MVACSSPFVLLVVTDSETKTAKYENNIETSISILYSQKIAIATTARFIIKSVITVYPLTLKQQA